MYNYLSVDKHLFSYTSESEISIKNNFNLFSQ